METFLDECGVCGGDGIAENVAKICDSIDDVLEFVNYWDVHRHECTDSTATNYNALATIDDGSCVYPCLDNTVDISVREVGSFGNYSLVQYGGTWSL